MAVDDYSILLGTSNETKKIEISRFFSLNSTKFSIKQLNYKLDMEEEGTNFHDIADWKVQKYSSYMPNKMFMSDDSGLCIDCLDGRPGIYSARFPYKGVSDAERNRVLIEVLKTHKEIERTATFYSAIAVGINGKVIASALGICKGLVICEPIGGNGFGFDPIFIPNGSINTFAEMTVDQKLKVSHRGDALRKILKLLEEAKNE